ncbi:MAG: winged helix-turn-helix domain-containing protein [Terracidiphilus sp.]
MQKRSADLAESPQERLAFASFQLEADGTLYRGETVIHLPPKELQALRLLVERAGQVVSPAQLRQALWGEVHVTADSVPRCVSSLRSRLGNDCIQTVYKRGYRLTAEVRRDSAPAQAGVLRLAVMPLATGPLVPEHLGPAISEETTSRLSNLRIPRLAIVARDSIFSLSGRGMSAEQVGRTLSADLVLTGTISILASSYRLRAEMIRVEDGAQIWVEDLIVPQTRAAGLETELVERLLSRFGAGGIAIAAAAEAEETQDATRKEALDHFRRGRYEWQSGHRHRMQDAIQHLKRALELDPGLTAARVGLVNLLVAHSFQGYMAPLVAAEEVERAAEAVPNLAEEAPAMLPAVGWIGFHFGHNLAAAEEAFAQSAHLPHDPWVTRLRVMLALGRHRFSEAIELLREAIRLDPFSAWLHYRLAWALHLAGQPHASVECVHHAVAQFRGQHSSALFAACILAYRGETAEALALAEEVASRQPYFDPATAVHAYALACAGRAHEAREALERLQWLSRERYVLPSLNPAVWLALGDRDAALADLRLSAESRCPWHFESLADPRLKPLHGDPEFERMRSVLEQMEEQAALAGE